MGSLCSCLKKRKDIQAPILSTSLYCARCGRTFIYNDYQKHIVTCEEIPENREISGGY